VEIDAELNADLVGPVGEGKHLVDHPLDRWPDPRHRILKGLLGTDKNSGTSAAASSNDSPRKVLNLHEYGFSGTRLKLN